MSVRNLADVHLSFAGMIVWLSSTVISALRSMRLPRPLGEPRQMTSGVAEHMSDEKIGQMLFDLANPFSRLRPDHAHPERPSQRA